MDEISGLIDRLDLSGMLGHIRSMPDHLEEGIGIGERAPLQSLETETFYSMIVSGMGGSAIAGDLLRSHLADDIRIPFQVQRHYRLPGFVGQRTLVICSSYSGNTEETLSAYDDAVARGASTIAITTGGKLAAKAKTDGTPLVEIPDGLPPRAAFGYSFAPLLVIVSRLGICDHQSSEIYRAASAQRARLSEYLHSGDKNDALSLARQLHGTIPVIYAGSDHLDGLAWRFKGQLCENSKNLAFVNLFPEFNHNEIVGWELPESLLRNLAVVVLGGKGDHPRVAARMEIVSAYLKGKDCKVIKIDRQFEEGLTNILLWVQFVDFVSYYLALLNGVDPTPVRPIEYLKEKLLKDY
jgi:glucose/mannose-6-phosphate isomerase